MMQALGALCVAALGGLTIATYRHPKEYQQLYLVLIIILVLGAITARPDSCPIAQHHQTARII